MRCRPGSHFVKRHIRISKNGVKHIVEAHCRKNSKSKKSFLYRSNLNYIYENFRNKYKYKNLKRIKGFSQDKGQYDELVQFWFKYWKDQGLIKEDIDPLLIKAIIAVESSFREKVITNISNSTATGLMQITKTTMRILAKKLGTEIRKFNIDITQNEAKEANPNIAAGVRWLIYKITTSPWKRKSSKKDRIFGGVKYYHSWDSDGEEYARKVLDLYNKSK
ncbi:MAG: transglycosylase SLT domain-containing protein [Bacteriovoracaceae bacterium]